MGQNLLQQVRVASGLNLLAALWLMASPYGLGFYLLNPPLWNSVIVGTAAAFFSILRLVMPFRYTEIGWLNIILGCWLIASPFIFRFVDVSAAYWNSLFVGLFMVLMAGWSVSVGRRGDRLLR